MCVLNPVPHVQFRVLCCREIPLCESIRKSIQLRFGLGCHLVAGKKFFTFIVPYFRVCNPHQTILNLTVKSGCGLCTNCAYRCGFRAVHAALPLSHTSRQNSPPSKVPLSLRKPDPITAPAFQASLLSSLVVAYYPLFGSPFCSLAVLVVGK